jgi:uncharacterized protein YqhQ
VGGIALFGGVLMLSRTGFAIALRRKDGRISLRQVPFTTFWKRSGRRKRFERFPLLRGAMMHLDMMEIGTKGLRYSSLADEKHMEEPEELDSRRLTMILLSSLLALMGLLVFLPNLLTEFLGLLAHWSGFLSSEAMLWFDEAESPIFFNLMAGLIRIGLLLGYVLLLSFDADIRRVFQYHGAEHKAVLALEENRDVTVDRARIHDTLHPRCGTTFLALACLVAVVVFAISDSLLPMLIGSYFERGWFERKFIQLLAHAVMLPVVVGLSFEVLRYCARRTRKPLCRAALWPGFLLQRLTTRHPNDEQLEVAIVALFGALAISPADRDVQRYVVRGLEDDPSAPGYIPRSPARPARKADEGMDDYQPAIH